VLELPCRAHRPSREFSAIINTLEVNLCLLVKCCDLRSILASSAIVFHIALLYLLLNESPLDTPSACVWRVCAGGYHGEREAEGRSGGVGRGAGGSEFRFFSARPLDFSPKCDENS